MFNPPTPMGKRRRTKIKKRPADLDGFEHKINRGSHMSNTGAVVKLQPFHAVNPYATLTETFSDSLEIIVYIATL